MSRHQADHVVTWALLCLVLSELNDGWVSGLWIVCAVVLLVTHAAATRRLKREVR